jgi:hypothetical protein
MGCSTSTGTTIVVLRDYKRITGTGVQLYQVELRLCLVLQDTVTVAQVPVDTLSVQSTHTTSLPVPGTLHQVLQIL